MIKEEIVPHLHEHLNSSSVELSGVWVQDGTPAHRRIIVTNRPRELFNHNAIALNHNPEWRPLRSPDLTPCDLFFFGGYLTSKVFKTPPRDIGTNDLRGRIITEMDALRGQRIMIRNVIWGMRARVETCAGYVEGHVERRY